MTTATMDGCGDVANRERIEDFFNTSSYQESLEVSATFNTRLSMERRQRLPFLDPQTGVAQRHCALYVKPKQRMPGLRSGQLYSYPGARWRKSKRQYLTNMTKDIETAISHQQMQQQQQMNGSLGLGSSFGTPSFFTSSTPSSAGGGGAFAGGLSVSSGSGGGAGGTMSGGFLLSQHDENSNSNASFLFDKSLGDSALLEGVVDTNSRDTNNNSKDELSKDWLYDDLDNEFDSEPKSADDEYDYDPRYGSKKRKAPKKEPKGKKTASAFGFDFGDSRSSGGSAKVRRTKEPGTPKKGASGSGAAASAESGTERRTRRKGAGAKGAKKFVEPPSFETAAAGFEEQLSFGGAWM